MTNSDNQQYIIESSDGAIYIRLNDKLTRETVSLGFGVYVDIDIEGNIRGIEVLIPTVEKDKTMNIAERLTSIRRESGMTSSAVRLQIQERTGKIVSLSYLSKLERGIQTNPGIKTLAYIAAGYDMTLLKLLSKVDIANDN